MKERPIIFNAEMVKAILDGRKTQTRRIMKNQPEPSETRVGDYWFLCDRFETMIHVSDMHPETSRYGNDYEWLSGCCPIGAIGDRLWVRETFAQGLCTKSTLAYKATHKPEDLEEGWFERIKWTPSIHMPRWASRINLEITGVRVERLNAISEADAIAEGCDYPAVDGMGWKFTAAFNFKFLWKKIYGEESLASNPFVWVIEFKQGGAV